MKKFTALLLCFIILFSFSSCGNKEPKNANKTIRYHLDTEPKTLDPQIASGSSASTLIEALYEGLVRLDSDNKPYAGTAKSWQANADFTEFTFILREEARWNDKTPVTADDFVYAFQRALTPQTNSSTCSPMFCIKNAKAVHEGSIPANKLGVFAKDAHTLVVSLAYSYENFPALTASPVFMPCHKAFFETTAGRYGLERSYILGNGPFIIDGPYGWEHGTHMNLKRSGTYSGQNLPLPSNLICMFGTKEVDLSDSIAALTAGKVDAAPISAEEITKAKEAGCTMVGFEDTTWGLCFNVQQKQELNPLQNLNIRKAFLQALDRKKVITHTPAGMSSAENILTPSTTLMGENYRSSAGGAFYPKHSTSAASLMKNGVQACGLEDAPQVKVLCPNNADTELMVNEIITEWNNTFDYYFNMESLPEEELFTRISSGNYEIALCPVQPSGDGPLNLLSLFKSSSKNNPAGLKSTAYDQLVENAEHENGASAAAAYAKAERYLNEQAIFYPLYYEKHFYASASGVTGIVFHPYGTGVDFIQAGKDK